MCERASRGDQPYSPPVRQRVTRPRGTARSRAQTQHRTTTQPLPERQSAEGPNLKLATPPRHLHYYGARSQYSNHLRTLRRAPPHLPPPEIPATHDPSRYHTSARYGPPVTLWTKLRPATHHARPSRFELPHATARTPNPRRTTAKGASIALAKSSNLHRTALGQYPPGNPGHRLSLKSVTLYLCSTHTPPITLCAQIPTCRTNL